MKKSPKFYVATALTRAKDADRVAAAFIYLGWEQTVRWTDFPIGITMQGGPEADHLRAECATKEVVGVQEADIVIVLLPGGRGTHVELGIAIGAGKPCLLVAENRSARDGSGYPCAFYSVAGVKVLYTTDVDKVVEAAIALIPTVDG